MVYNKKILNELDVSGKTVFLRLDLNVPVDNGVITSYKRINSTLPTIKYLLDNNAKIVILSHFGRPTSIEDIQSGKFSLEIVARALAQKIGKLASEISFISESKGHEVNDKIASLRERSILVLENTRFNDIGSDGSLINFESGCNDDLAKYWAGLCDVFVNDAYGAAHRNHASTDGIARYQPNNAIGFLMNEELKTLTRAVEQPVRPFTVIFGGAKVSDKSKAVEATLKIADKVIISGGMAYTFLAAQGYDMGLSKVEYDFLDEARRLLAEYPEKLVISSDFLCSPTFSNTEPVYLTKEQGLNGYMGLDIGERSIKEFEEVINASNSILWNGPMGVTEFSYYTNGTNAICDAIAKRTELGAFTVIGGGDSAAAAEKLGKEESFSWISTGGGASLVLIEGKPLAGINSIEESLKKKIIINKKRRILQESGVELNEVVDMTSSFNNVYETIFTHEFKDNNVTVIDIFEDEDINVVTQRLINEIYSINNSNIQQQENINESESVQTEQEPTVEQEEQSTDSYTYDEIINATQEEEQDPEVVEEIIEVDETPVEEDFITEQEEVAEELPTEQEFITEEIIDEEPEFVSIEEVEEEQEPEFIEVDETPVEEQQSFDDINNIIEEYESIPTESEEEVLFTEELPVEDELVEEVIDSPVEEESITEEPTEEVFFEEELPVEEVILDEESNDSINDEESEEEIEEPIITEPESDLTEEEQLFFNEIQEEINNLENEVSEEVVEEIEEVLGEELSEESKELVEDLVEAEVEAAIEEEIINELVEELNKDEPEEIQASENDDELLIEEVQSEQEPECYEEVEDSGLDCKIVDFDDDSLLVQGVDQEEVTEDSLSNQDESTYNDIIDSVEEYNSEPTEDVVEEEIIDEEQTPTEQEVYFEEELPVEETVTEEVIEELPVEESVEQEIIDQPTEDELVEEVFTETQEPTEEEVLFTEELPVEETVTEEVIEELPVEETVTEEPTSTIEEVEETPVQELQYEDIDQEKQLSKSDEEEEYTPNIQVEEEEQKSFSKSEYDEPIVYSEIESEIIQLEPEKEEKQPEVVELDISNIKTQKKKRMSNAAIKLKNLIKTQKMNLEKIEKEKEEKQ